MSSYLKDIYSAGRTNIRTRLLFGENIGDRDIHPPCEVTIECLGFTNVAFDIGDRIVNDGFINMLYKMTPYPYKRNIAGTIIDPSVVGSTLGLNINVDSEGQFIMAPFKIYAAPLELLYQ